MALSVNGSNGGTGLSGLLRQTRQAKPEDAPASAPSEQPTTVSVRPAGRSGIDSTERGTAHIAAALTVYLSKLGGSEEGEPASIKAKTGAVAVRDGTSSPTAGLARSGAADLLRTLDSYRAGDAWRLTA